MFNHTLQVTEHLLHHQIGVSTMSVRHFLYASAVRNKADDAAGQETIARWWLLK
jgi:hypothetical protein